jgi:hypothetical protein
LAPNAGSVDNNGSKSLALKGGSHCKRRKKSRREKSRREKSRSSRISRS